MCRSSRCSKCFLKDRFVHCAYWHVASMATITVHWIITLKDCTLLFLLLLPSNLSIFSIQSVLISKDLWGLGKSLTNYSREEVSQHMCGFELSKFFLWLSRTENVSWKPETSALVLIIFDEQIGMYSFLLGHMLHNSFQWQLLYTLWKKTLLPSQDHRRWMKKSKWRICRIVVRLWKGKNWSHHCEVPDFA